MLIYMKVFFDDWIETINFFYVCMYVCKTEIILQPFEYQFIEEYMTQF